MGFRKVAGDNFRNAIKRYEQGETIASIAQSFGVKPHGLGRRFRLAGVRMRGNMKICNIEHVQDIIHRYLENETSYSIAKRYHVNATTICSLLKRYKITVSLGARKRICKRCGQVAISVDDKIRLFEVNRMICRTCARICRTELSRNRKTLVIKEYGGKCACCSENRVEFLTIDHIDGKGEHRGMIYRYLINNHFPKDHYRILCMNCNFSLGKYGYCPHAAGITQNLLDTGTIKYEKPRVSFS